MKNLLIGTTALVAAGTLALPAQSAERIKMGVGGYFQAFLVTGSQDVPGLHDVKLAREGEIIFNGSTKLDNGVSVGVQVQLEAESCDDQIDESYIYFSGGFGKIVLGSENSAAVMMHYASPVPAISVNYPNFRVAHPNGNVAYHATYAQATEDSEKVTYMTPRIGGIQVGLSYTPDNTEAQTHGSKAGGGSYSSFQGAADDGQQSDIIEVAGNFVQSFGGVNVAMSVSAGMGSLEAGDGDDLQEYTTGFSVNFQGFTLGAGYRHSNLGLAGDNTNAEHINVGLKYSAGPWSIGVQYANSVVDAGATPAGHGDHEQSAFEVGGEYNLGSGVKLRSAVQQIEYDGNNGLKNAADSGNNEATIFYLGTSIAF